MPVTDEETKDEEAQAREFLKRAEIRTMKKDLTALREVDALKERDKIVKLKTLEEQLEEKKKADAALLSKEQTEKAGMEEVLTKNEGEEKIAEKDLKKYATEEERQQIFLLESQRLGFEKQIDAIDKEKDPALKLQKNELLLQKGDQQARLNSILDEEKRQEQEEKFIIEKEQTTAIASQKKSLEQSKEDLDKKIQDVEKKRWEAEKEVQDTDNKIGQIDKSSDQLVTEKNSLRDKILGTDKSLRDIYSAAMTREEERRSGQAQEQIAKREALSKVKSEQKEKIQREQWSGPGRKQIKEEGYLAKAPAAFKERIIKSSEAEEEQRKKFLQDIENWAEDKGKNQPQVIKQENMVPPPAPKMQPETQPAPPKPLVPLAPRKKISI